MIRPPNAAPPEKMAFAKQPHLTHAEKAPMESRESLQWLRGRQEKYGVPPSNSRKTGKVYNCADPYRLPGYLYINPDKESYRDTRWVPYTSKLFESPDPPQAQYPPPANPDVYFDPTPVEPDFLNDAATPQQWMHTAVAESEKRRKETKNSKDVQDYISKKDEGPLSWLWGRRVLLIGDSIDRFMIEYFCQEMGYKFSYPQVHKNSICEIPSFNMTLVHWHLAGTPTYKAKWWWDSPMKIVPFEERWEKEWAPTLSTHVRGLDGRKPDLVMWQIGQWDKHNLFSMAESHFNESDFMRKDERPLVWQEIRFLAARYKKFISLIHNEFGSDVPAMFRALTADRSTDKSEMQLFEMDRLERAVAEWSGLEIFEWGRILTAFTGVYRDMRHVGKGPGSWLWGNMVLEYLARSAGVGDESRAPYFNGWQACHDELNHGGGR